MAVPYPVQNKSKIGVSINVDDSAVGVRGRKESILSGAHCTL